MPIYKVYDAKGNYWKWLKLNPGEVQHLRKSFKKMRFVKSGQKPQPVRKRAAPRQNLYRRFGFNMY